MGEYCDNNGCKKYSRLEIFHREPSHNGRPINGFSPVQGNQLNFLDMSNDGLTLGTDLNKEAIEFWNHIGEEINNITNST